MPPPGRKSNRVRWFVRATVDAFPPAGGMATSLGSDRPSDRT